MKVILLNGSPHVKGTTNRALEEVAISLNNNGVETEIIQIGKENIVGCRGCSQCKNLGKCFIDDIVNQTAEKLNKADGIIVGTPVYFASSNGTIISFLDRLFCSDKNLKYKPAAAIAVARRTGCTSSIDEINKYFTINNMPIVSSQYWNVAFGANADDVVCDEEGIQTLRILGENMAWLLKCIEMGEKNGINKPNEQQHIRTNFIRR